MIPGLIHGKCFAGGQCSKYCTSFKRPKDSIDDKCDFCHHDISVHEIIGVVDSSGVPTLSVTSAAPQKLTIPVTTARERNMTFTRAGIYKPHSAGKFDHFVK